MAPLAPPGGVGSGKDAGGPILASDALERLSALMDGSQAVLEFVASEVAQRLALPADDAAMKAKQRVTATGRRPSACAEAISVWNSHMGGCGDVAQRAVVVPPPPLPLTVWPESVRPSEVPTWAMAMPELASPAPSCTPASDTTTGAERRKGRKDKGRSAPQRLAAIAPRTPGLQSSSPGGLSGASPGSPSGGGAAAAEPAVPAFTAISLCTACCECGRNVEAVPSLQQAETASRASDLHAPFQDPSFYAGHQLNGNRFLSQAQAGFSQDFAFYPPQLLHDQYFFGQGTCSFPVAVPAAPLAKPLLGTSPVQERLWQAAGYPDVSDLVLGSCPPVPASLPQASSSSEMPPPMLLGHEQRNQVQLLRSLLKQDEECVESERAKQQEEQERLQQQLHPLLQQHLQQSLQSVDEEDHVKDHEFAEALLKALSEEAHGVVREQ